MIIHPGDVSTKDFHAYLLGSVAPRPIALASTIDENGLPNLSPFSFFNVFGSLPPICVFSPARRVRDNTTKHTLKNVELNKEVVIAVVNYDMVQQVSLASCEYPDGTNEFEKSGLTPIKGTQVKPFLVKESPVNLECKVKDIIYTGENGGAGNLIVCEIVAIHIDDKVLGADNMIDPHKIDLVARMGKDFYCRASGDAVFEVPKPNLQLGMGFDKLPMSLKNSTILTGNDLAQLANHDSIPELPEEFSDDEIVKLIDSNVSNTELLEKLHQYIHQLLIDNHSYKAWLVLSFFEKMMAKS